ncbi:kinesin-like protein KIF12 isoform X2 [Coccinella septempunctata]|uniref:kinesin-like protein KIF12 isoform X2 n=1 Tax=Coccinella septempunctata TaxID=41139 RepID=UPI001D08BAA3|nr:kinesin-like protein KIF12 isoform X2 [Coccinella septempunctata]
MVTRSSNFIKTPPSSRGNSPSRTSNNKNNRPSPSQSPNSRLPLRASPRKAFGSPDRKNKVSPEIRSIKSRGNSPARSNGEFSLPGSRGSEYGSIERLDDDNNLRRIITSFNQDEDNINVVVRVRPISEKEKRGNDKNVIQFPGNGQILVDNEENGSGGGSKSKLFSYNVVFEPAATQEDVLQFSGMKRLIEMSLEGFRCTCFCYGQTGSGKTYTLTGPPGLFGLKPSPYSDKHGLIFRSFLYLFQLIKEKSDVHFILKASYLEIYNEKVIDLLNPGSSRKPLAVRWSKKARGFFVENLFTVDCEELDDLTAVLEEGLRNRSVGKHNMNDFSSRSHTILTVYISSEQPAENGVFLSRSGKIHFVDLAGSEMTKKTQSRGKTLEEANNINKSLMVLGYCISSLSDQKRKTKHIPYRDSKLTKLLADSLAGNGVTLMIACISPARCNRNETINTLRYAARAKKIRTKPIVLMDPREALILSLKREVSVLQNENEHLRSALLVYSRAPGSAYSGDSETERRRIATPPHVEVEKLQELDTPQLVELLKLYITENELLKKDNYDLFSSREMLQRDHEMVCRENERLLKKVEEVNESPLIAARPAFSAEMLNTTSDSDVVSNIWTNPMDTKKDDSNRIPASIEKELEKRQIGKMTPLRRHRSWDDKPKSAGINRTKSHELPSPTNKKNSSRKGKPIEVDRRFSIANEKNGNLLNASKKMDIFGSVISLTDEDG